MVSFKQLSAAGAALLTVTPQTIAEPIEASPKHHLSQLIARSIVDSAPSEALELWARNDFDGDDLVNALSRAVSDDEIVADLAARGFMSKFIHKNKEQDKSKYPAQSKKPEKGLPAMPSRKQAEAGVRYKAPSRSSTGGGRARPIPKKAHTMRRDLADELDVRGFMSKFIHKNKEQDKSKYPAQSKKPEKGLPAMPSRKQAEAGVRYKAPSGSSSGGRARPVPKKAKTI
ncbi:unnamed protein product [Clonostachys rhizophaga]|uniref:Uncharacterized protein n=1 Tax=Clonostachys rhizophaga TaxID=160324 RepID=A0A9N9YNX0_9HYPO|nr:unnamed protein product [Clonostachys rhizophaga]